MGTPADKPIAVDGVFYVPMRIARLAGMKEDKVLGYARIEQPLMALPFQFYSYSCGGKQDYWFVCTRSSN